MTLDGRKGRILHAIVRDYVDTAEPIGSEWLVTRYDFGCKSATLRNEMAEMSDLGYLVQPHTSAGRIPSHTGYRYYVDNLMPVSTTPISRKKMEMPTVSDGLQLEEIVKFACKSLAAVTRYPSVATAPSTELIYLHRLFITRADSRHLLLVMLLSTGGVEHRLIELRENISDEFIERVAGRLNNELSHMDINDVANFQGISPSADSEAFLDFQKMVLGHCRDAVHRMCENRVFLEGATFILRQREFQDVLRLEQLLSILEQNVLLHDVISRAISVKEVSIVIGAESALEAMSDCSLVTSRYNIGEKQGGYIGVLGPTRMNYDEAVPAVSQMARSLSALLTRASLT
ncbi:MAG: heat-inducible transcriptional repressor HrcA [Chthonomonadales bacterium]